MCLWKLKSNAAFNPSRVNSTNSEAPPVSVTALHNNRNSPIVPLAPFLPDNIAGVKESANPAEFPTLNVGGCVPIVEVKLVTFWVTSGKDTK